MFRTCEIKLNDIVRSEILASESLPLKKYIKRNHCIFFTVLFPIIYRVMKPNIELFLEIPVIIFFMIFVYYVMKTSVYNQMIENTIKKYDNTQEYTMNIELKEKFIKLDYSTISYEVTWEEIKVAEEDKEYYYLNFGKSDHYHILKKINTELSDVENQKFEEMIKNKLGKRLKESTLTNENEIQNNA